MAKNGRVSQCLLRKTKICNEAFKPRKEWSVFESFKLGSIFNRIQSPLYYENQLDVCLTYKFNAFVDHEFKPIICDGRPRKELLDQAKLGPNADKVKDYNIKTSLQLDSSDISIGGCDELFDLIRKSYFFGKKNIRFEFTKLLIFQQGGYVKEHQSKVNENNRIATLLVGLDSYYEGGDFVFKINDQNKARFHVSNNRHVLFYPDFIHSTESVTRGTRVVAYFNVFANEDQPEESSIDFECILHAIARNAWSSLDDLKLFISKKHQRGSFDSRNKHLTEDEKERDIRFYRDGEINYIMHYHNELVDLPNLLELDEVKPKLDYALKLLKIFIDGMLKSKENLGMISQYLYPFKEINPDKIRGIDKILSEYLINFFNVNFVPIIINLEFHDGTANIDEEQSILRYYYHPEILSEENQLINEKVNVFFPSFGELVFLNERYKRFYPDEKDASATGEYSYFGTMIVVSSKNN